MNIATRYKKGFYVALSLAGLAYFAACSQLEISLPFLKAYAAGIPIQLAALIYVVLYIRNRNFARSRAVANSAASGAPFELDRSEVNSVEPNGVEPDDLNP